MHGVANSRLDISNLLLPLHLVSELNLGRLSAPDVRFKLAVLSIVLDILLNLIVGKLRK